MTNIGQLLTFLLLFLSVSSQLDEDARQRFEQILADFGFSQTSRATVRDPNRQKAFASDPQKIPVKSSQPSQPRQPPADIRGLRVGLRRPKRPESVKPPPSPPPALPVSSSSRPGQRLTPQGVPIVNINNDFASTLQDFSTELLRSRQRNTPGLPAQGGSVLSSRVRPGLTNLLAIAGDPKSTPRSFVVRNRARTRQTSPRPPPPPPPALSVGDSDVSNTFINPALSVLRTTTPSPATTIASPLSSLENINKLSSPVRESRITIPRLKSSLAFKENMIDSEPQYETMKQPTTSNRKKEKPETKEKKPKEKRPRQKKGNIEMEKSKRQRPPMSTVCSSLCNTLIFEAYQLLGGRVCDC